MVLVTASATDGDFVLANVFSSAEFHWTTTRLTSAGRREVNKTDWVVPSLDLLLSRGLAGARTRDASTYPEIPTSAQAVDSWTTLQANRADKVAAVTCTRRVLGKRCLYCLSRPGSFCYGCGVWDIMCCTACSILVPERRVPELIADPASPEPATLCDLCFGHLDEKFCRQCGIAPRRNCKIGEQCAGHFYSEFAGRQVPAQAPDGLCGACGPALPWFCGPCRESYTCSQCATCSAETERCVQCKTLFCSPCRPVLTIDISPGSLFPGQIMPGIARITRICEGCLGGRTKEDVQAEERVSYLEPHTT